MGILTTRSVGSSRALGDKVVRVGTVETEALVAATLLFGDRLGSVGGAANGEAWGPGRCEKGPRKVLYMERRTCKRLSTCTANEAMSATRGKRAGSAARACVICSWTSLRRPLKRMSFSASSP